MYSFIITETRTGRVLDMGTFTDVACAVDTAQDSKAWKVSNRYTLVRHDKTGFFRTITDEVIREV